MQDSFNTLLSSRKSLGTQPIFPFLVSKSGLPTHTQPVYMYQNIYVLAKVVKYSV